MSTTAEAATRTRSREVIETRAEPGPEAPTGRSRLGSLLAVCGLAGGAGTTTLAYLVALAAARESSEPVLVADSGGPSGGLAALAGVETLLSLPELADDLAAGRPLRGGLYATGPAGLRVLAAGPVFSARAAGGPLKRLLADAREAHELTVIDCGTLGREVDCVVAGAATHIAWVLPATAHGVRCAGRILDAASALAGREILVARNATDGAKAPIKQMRRLAAERRAPLVLVPNLAELHAARLDRAIATAQVPLQSILGALQR